MVNVKRFISSNFTQAFFTIFLPFFLIISLIYLVKISSLTAQIQITFGELLQLYGYSIPDIVFYTLPLSFIAALANVLSKLSSSNELIALYALGFKSGKILRGLIMTGILFSILLGALSFLGMPLSKQFYKSFISSKKSEAKLNIVPGKLGQKFGDYYVYVKEKQKNDFHDVVIYNRTDKNEEQFFSAQKGKLNKNKGITSMLLTDGYGYTYAETSLRQAKYKTLEVYDKNNKKNYQFEDIIAYWSRAATDQKIMHRALFFTFVSLIPFLSVYIVSAFTMINPRYQENYSFVVIFLTTLLLYLLASSLEKWGTFTTLGVSIVIIFLCGKWIFEKRVAKHF